MCERTTVNNGQVAEVGPAGSEQDGCVSFKPTNAVSIRVLQAGCNHESRHSHGDAVSLQTLTKVSVNGHTHTQRTNIENRLNP